MKKKGRPLLLPPFPFSCPQFLCSALNMLSVDEHFVYDAQVKLTQCLIV